MFALKCIPEDGDVEQLKVEQALIQNLEGIVDIITYPSGVRLYSLESKGKAPKRRYGFLMDCIYGFDLDYLNQVMPMPLRVVKLLIWLLLTKVADFHRQGLCLRDLKPSNLMIDVEQWQLKIIDYGLSKYVQDDNFSDSHIVGTKDYMAPEILKGSHDMKLADAFACGKIISELTSIVDKPEILCQGLSEPDPKLRFTVEIALHD
jgi:serine/threonine protein kinase